MPFSNIDEQNLGNTLITMFSKNIRSQMKTDYPEFELVQSKKAETTGARQIQYAVQTSLGPSSIQYGNPGVIGPFPGEQQTEQTEATAKLKELNATVSFDYKLYRRLLESKDKYDADRLKREVESKNAALRRQICIDFYGDGTGALATVQSVQLKGGRAVVTCQNEAGSRGFSGNCQLEEKVKTFTAAGTAGTTPTVSSGTFDHWRVIDRQTEMDINSVTLVACAANGAALTVTVWAPSAGELIYKAGQAFIPDVSGAVADYGIVGPALTGLRSLVANDGRVVNGLKAEGALAAQVVDCEGNQIGLYAIERGMNKVMNAVNQGQYKWPKALMNRYVLSTFIESNETDRRLISVNDDTRGAPGFAYLYGRNKIVFEGAEFCPYQDIYVLPEGTEEGHRAIEYYGMDFDAVREPGSQSVWRLAPSGNTHTSKMLMYLYGGGQLVNNHAAACLAIRNFKA